MVRVGGLAYTIDPAATIGRRISQLELAGKPLDAAKTSTGWQAGPVSIRSRMNCPTYGMCCQNILWTLG